MDMKYENLFDAMANMGRWVRDSFFGADNGEKYPHQSISLGTVLMSNVKIIETTQGTVAKDGTIYEDGHPVGTIETLDRETVITDHSTMKKIFIYDNGDIFDDNGLKLGTVTKSGSTNTIRDSHGRCVTLKQKALKNLEFVCVA
jgi:hypothetical protein